MVVCGGGGGWVVDRQTGGQTDSRTGPHFESGRRSD